SDAPTPGITVKEWDCRVDPFSSFRSTFEVRTYRLCQRLLMFHHFPAEAGVGQDCLGRSTDFTDSYQEAPSEARNPVYSFLRSVTQSGYKRKADGGYIKQSLPSLDFDYSSAEINKDIQDVGGDSLENVPFGVDGALYRLIDLDGEGLPGI